MAQAIGVWYLAAIRWYAGGELSPSQVDEGFSKSWEWGVGVPDVDTWGRGGTRGGMAGIKDQLA